MQYNRALRRLATKNKTHPFVIHAMQQAGAVHPNERRISAEKIAAFIELLNVGLKIKGVHHG